MKIPLYDNNMNFVTTFELHHTLSDLLKKWGFVHVNLPKPMKISFSYADCLTPSLPVFQIRIRLEHFVRNGEKHPFYFVEADSEVLEFLQHYNENDGYQNSVTNYQKWKTSQIEKYTKSSTHSSSQSLSPTPSMTVAKVPVVEEDDDGLSWSLSMSPSPSEEPTPSVSASAAVDDGPEEVDVTAGTTKVQGGKTFVYTGSQWLPVDIPLLKTLKIEKAKKPKAEKKKIGLPKEQLKRNIILE